jgi:hypothetical protein
MNLNDLNAYFGVLGGIAGAGSLYYAWKNDKLARFIPHDRNIDEAFSGNENSPGLADRVRAMLSARVGSRRKLRVALSVAGQMHFARPMDDALVEISLRAIELGDLSFAYHVATKAHFALALDKMLQNVVNAALKRGNIKLAQKCANRMHFAVPADNARKQILVAVNMPKSRPKIPTDA